MTPEEKRKLADWIRKLVKDEVDKAMSKPKRQKKDYPANFERVYSAYPKQVAKDEALKAYNKLDHDVWTDDMLIKSFKDHAQEWAKNDPKFIPALGPYLNKGRHKDEIKTVRKADSRRRCVCGAYALDGQDKCAKCQCERKE